MSEKFVKVNDSIIRFPGGRKSHEKQETVKEKEPMWAGCRRELRKFGVSESSDISSLISKRKLTESERDGRQGGFGHIAGNSGGAGALRTINDGRNRRMIIKERS